MDKQFASAIDQICSEKNISKEVVIDTIEDALAAAYKKDYGNKKQEVRVELSDDGSTIVYVSKEIVDEVEDKFTQISQEDAFKFKKDAKVGETIEIKDMPSDFGRIAAQTAKQVIIQRIREAERDMVFGEYKDKEGEVINGTVQRIEGNNVIIDLGKASGVLFPNEQIRDERYYVGQRLKFFVVRVEQNARGPQIVISRSHPGLVKRLFELEVPEILSGVVEIKSIARESGERTKIAVSSTQDGVDPVGSCVGQRGVRVQAVMSEIGEEKIDIILWDEDPKVYISNALSPAKVSEIILNEEEKKAEVKVAEDQLSLAIGRQGQNVRLAAKLTGWNVDIQGGDEAGIEAAARMIHPVEDRRDLEGELLKAVEGGEETSKPVEAEKENETPAQEPEAPAITTQPDTDAVVPTGDAEAAETNASEESEISTNDNSDMLAQAVDQSALDPEPAPVEAAAKEPAKEATEPEAKKPEAEETEPKNVDEVAAILEEEQDEKAS